MKEEMSTLLCKRRINRIVEKSQMDGSIME